MAERIAGSADGILRLLARQAMGAVPLFCTLATTGAGNLPSARTVVIRQVDAAEGSLWLSTHAGADKVKQLRKEPIGELVVWLSEKRLQVRLRCTWRVIDAAAAARFPALAKVRAAAWERHSEKSRSMFAWPAPGQVMTPSLSRQMRERPSAAILATSPPPAFAILVGAIDQMDALSIGERLHRRYLHERQRRKWKTTAITP